MPGLRAALHFAHRERSWDHVDAFRKVGVANRVELARAVEHAELDTSDLATQ
jgi:hypothetical protein